MQDDAYPITDVDRIPIEVPFREVPARNMARELPHWRYFDVVRVEIDDAHVGYGETMLYYTWGETTAADVDRAVGQDAFDLLWDDSIGPGLQMALFDGLGRALDVPAHALLGERVRETVPVAWWCIDMPPEDLVAEAHTALDAGYTDFKLKARPWFDLREQLSSLDGVLPPTATIGLDFNDTLLDADRAIPVLNDVTSHSRVSVIESPICHTAPSDESTIADCRAILDAVDDVDVILHYIDDPRPALRNEVCDGFVLAWGGATDMTRKGAVASEVEMPSFVQYVGTEITASFAVHLASVIPAATHPIVTCHEIFEPTVTTEPLSVSSGVTPVPDGAGLAIDVDDRVLDRLRIDRPEERPAPDRLIEVSCPDGGCLYVAGSVNGLLDVAREGAPMPHFERGVETRSVPDDGSDTWRELHNRAKDGVVVVEPADGPVV